MGKAKRKQRKKQGHQNKAQKQSTRKGASVKSPNSSNLVNHEFLKRLSDCKTPENYSDVVKELRLFTAELPSKSPPKDLQFALGVGLLRSGQLLEGLAQLLKCRNRLSDEYKKSLTKLGLGICEEFKLQEKLPALRSLANQELLSIGIFCKHNIESKSIQNSELYCCIVQELFQRKEFSSVSKILTTKSANSTKKDVNAERMRLTPDIFVDRLKIGWLKSAKLQNLTNEFALVLSACATFLVSCNTNDCKNSNESNRHQVTKNQLHAFKKELLLQAKDFQKVETSGQLSKQLETFLDLEIDILLCLINSKTKPASGIYVTPFVLNQFSSENELVLSYKNNLETIFEKGSLSDEDKIYTLFSLDAKDMSQLFLGGLSPKKAALFAEKFLNNFQDELFSINLAVLNRILEIPQLAGIFEKNRAIVTKLISILNNPNYLKYVSQSAKLNTGLSRFLRTKIADESFSKKMSAELKSLLADSYIKDIPALIQETKDKWYFGDYVNDDYPDEDILIDIKALIDSYLKLKSKAQIQQEVFELNERIDSILNANVEEIERAIKKLSKIDSLEPEGKGKKDPDLILLFDLFKCYTEHHSILVDIVFRKEKSLVKFLKNSFPEEDPKKLKELFAHECMSCFENIVRHLERAGKKLGYEALTCTQMMSFENGDLKINTGNDSIQTHTSQVISKLKMNSPYEILCVDANANKQKIMFAVADKIKNHPELAAEAQIARMELFDQNASNIHRFFRSLESVTLTKPFEILDGSESPGKFGFGAKLLAQAAKIPLSPAWQ